MIDGNIEEFSRQVTKFMGSHSFHNFHRMSNKDLTFTRASNDDDNEDGEGDDDGTGTEATANVQTNELNPPIGKGSTNSASSYSSDDNHTSIFKHWTFTSTRMINERTIRNIYVCAGNL